MVFVLASLFLFLAVKYKSFTLYPFRSICRKKQKTIENCRKLIEFYFYLWYNYYVLFK